MGFEDTTEEFDPDAVDDETSVGDEAMDELAGTLSGESSTDEEQDTSADVVEETAATGTEATPTDDEQEADSYDAKDEPAFPSAKSRTQHSVYVLPEWWHAVDGGDDAGPGLLFEAESELRFDGYSDVQKRELQSAFFRAAVEELDAEDIANALVATREDRESDGPLLDDE